MPTIPAPNDQWYVIHVLSGEEQKVRDRMQRRIDAEELSDVVFEILVPEERVSEVKAGKKSEASRKFYPGYIIVNMHLLESDNTLVGRTWYFVQETDGVINFAGSKDRPMPMPMSEVEGMLQQIKEREGSITPAISHEVGDSVVVSDGPFQGQNGVIAEIDQEKGEIMVSVNIFGRETLVPLEHWQVETG